MKMGTTGKIFDKNWLKVIRDAFFPICGLEQGRESGHGGIGGLNFSIRGKSRGHPTGGKILFQNFGHKGALRPSLSMKLDPFW